MEKKICSKCKIEKDVCEFYKNKTRFDGKRPECKMCSNKQSTSYNQKNKEKVNIIKQKYIDNNKEKVKQTKKEWFDKNPEYKKEHYNKNINHILEKSKKHYNDNREKIIEYNKKYSKINREVINKRNKIKYETNVLYKLKLSMRGRLNSFLKTKQIKKHNKTFEIIGCIPEYLKEHIEKQFVDNMCWENYGLYGWHIDHIIPLSSAKTEEEIYELCHYINLQPLWAEDNLKKSNKILS
jgi:hypothetical protein